MHHMSKKNMMKYTMPLHEYAGGHDGHHGHDGHDGHHSPHHDHKQGYNDRLDESLEMRHPHKHHQDMKARRDESRGERHHMAATDHHVRPY